MDAVHRSGSASSLRGRGAEGKEKVIVFGPAVAATPSPPPPTFEERPGVANPDEEDGELIERPEDLIKSCLTKLRMADINHAHAHAHRTRRSSSAFSSSSSS